jgi:CHAT domain-containing protein
MSNARIAFAAAFLALAFAPSEAAPPLSVRDSFRIGTSGSSYCSAQPIATDPALKGMFDVAYAITCRDAILPVGKIYKLSTNGDPGARLAALRNKTVECATPTEGSVKGLGRASITECRLKDADVGYRAIEYRQGRTMFVAEGLAGYASALELGLRSIVADKPIDGEISIATTGAGDPAAFARVQAGTLDSARALVEAYRRNNLGSYADAAEFFAAASSSSDGPISEAEALMNEALQKSNLGRDEESASLFERAKAVLDNDPLDSRRLRNYRAIYFLNQNNPDEALKELDKPVPELPAESVGDGKAPEIDAAMSKRLNRESTDGHFRGEDKELLPREKAQILDGQSFQLRGTAMRLQEKYADARTALQSADQQLQGVRGGRVTSIVWMRAQILDDLALLAEQGGNAAEADDLFRQSVALLETRYPGSAALLNSRARLAGYLARSGRGDEALSMFHDIIHSQADASDLPPSFARVVKPYVDLLLQKPGDPASLGEMFIATQLMVRPGLAQTQAILARQLSAGSGEASRLFRQAVTLTREVQSTRAGLARLDERQNLSADDVAKAAEIRATLETSEKEALETQSALASYPRFRVVSSNVIPMSELQANLRPGEAYYKMTIVGDAIYAMLIEPKDVHAAKLDIAADVLDGEVTSLRDTILTIEDGRQVTYAYDVALAHKIYTDLFAPFQGRIPHVTHLIFEPDGPMLRLPANPLVMDQASVDLYAKRVAADPKADFNFTGIHWLGRDRDISTSVSPRSFANLRQSPLSRAPKEYLGLGHNTPPPAETTQLIPAAADRDCILPLATWGRPISDRELTTAANILGKRNPGGVKVITGDGFTDQAVASESDLSQYRILHFATHGVVTAPRAKCPSQPALLTSFGGKGSDGLLTFREIFELNLDADVVILSACDTAGKASALATRSAGLGSGGDVELDGLVRAFVGAGGRLVIASHWPVPDDFNATQRLISGLFAGAPGTPTVTALRRSEVALMDDVNTSHPFYWAAFAAVGDGDIPIIPSPVQVAAK